MDVKAASCAKQVAKARRLPVLNDVKTGKLTARVEAGPSAADAPVGDKPAAEATSDQAGSVYLLASSASSTTSSDLAGSFAATDLKPSGTWQVGPSGGSFSYSVPITVPPAPGGQTPKFSLDYSSASVDSLTAETNNQASWVGDGWDLGSGFIERHYNSCTADDSLDGPRHLCWDANNDLTLSVAGRSSRIVKDAASGTSGSWRTQEDYGWKVEQIAASTDPGNPGEPYWKVTTQDGTVYRFGYHRDSSFQTPYLAKNTGDPCYNPEHSPMPFPGAPQFCTAPWRWMLDQEIDPKGNVIDYSYSREQGHYCLTSGDLCHSGANLAYDRGGYLAQVVYGSNVSVAGSTPTGRVVFNTLSRDEGVIGGSYQDFPFDLMCDDPTSNGFCTTTADGPTFFVTRRLNTVVTQTWNTATSGWDDVSRWELGYKWVQTDPGQTFTNPVLWLDTVRRVGLAGSGPDVIMPPIQFDATLLDAGHNITDRYPRITGVSNGMGGRTEVAYGQPSGCNLQTRTNANVRDRAGYDCYWAYRGEYSDASGTYTEGNVYNKWQVLTVTDKDLVGGSPDVVTRYEYVGTPAWARETTFGQTPTSYDVQPPMGCFPGWFGLPPDCTTSWDSWTQWRGYPTVRTIKGSGTDPAGYTVTSATFYRGMYDDVYNDGTPKHAQVTDFDGNTYNDLRVLAGRTLQEQTWRATGWSTPPPKCVNPAWSSTASYPANWPVSYNGHDWWAIAPSTGKAPAPGSAYWSDQGACPVYTSGLSGYTEEGANRYEYVRTTTGDGPGIADPLQINISRQVARDKVSSGWRYTENATTYNADGLPIKVNDYGDRSTTADNTCMSTTYVRNTTKWLINYVASEEKHAGDDCSAGTLLSRSVTLYDGSTDPSTNTPTAGNITESRDYDTASTYTATKSTFDGYGRVLTSTDPLGKTTTTSYSPSAGWPTGGVTATNPLGHTATTWPSAWGGVVGVRDSNGNDSNIDYDALGRPTTLWTPAQPKSGGTAAATISYTITFDGNMGQPTAPARTTMNRLQSGSGTTATWVSTASYIDGLARHRESQAASPAGGRIVTATGYDTRGLAASVSAPFYNSSAPGSGLLNAAWTSLPQWSTTVYDGMQRPVTQIDKSASSEVRRTTTTYYGDRTETQPPLGGKTVTYTDADSRATKVEQWLDGTTHNDTTYSYDASDRLIKTVDANGNSRTFTYDLLGRKLTTHDPDAGDSQSSYDPAGQVTWTTDGKNQKISYTYDDLGRKTAQWAGDPGTGTKLAAWVYDTLAKGQLTSATRITGGNAYSTTVTGYDLMNRPTGSTISVPSVTGIESLAGDYTFSYAYNTAGDQSDITMPAAAGLPAEKVTSSFTDLGYDYGLTSDLAGGATYVKSTSYTATGLPAGRSYGANAQVTRSLSWDTSTGRLANITTLAKADTPTPVTAQKDDFFYNVDDTINRVLDKASAIAGVTAGQQECFTYDGLHRLSAGWTTTAATCGTGASSGDGQGIDPYAESYTYDAVGNLTTLTSSGQAATYHYPTPGATAVRPNAVTGIDRPAGTDSYSYDNAGQMTARTVAGKQSTFTWDELGELTKATVDGSDTTMVYDAEGNRLIRRDPTKTVLYLGPMELELAGTALTAKRYYTAPDGSTVAMRTTAGLTWLASGLHGSEQLAITDATGQVSRERYLPYGKRRGIDDLPFTDHGFLGKVEDDSTGLDYLSARYYDPSIAKFISTDPLLVLSNPQWTNPYSYAADNPIGLSDPTGLIPEDYTYGQNGGVKGWHQDQEAAKHHQKIRPHPTYAPAYRGHESGGICNAKCKKDIKNHKIDKMVAKIKAAEKAKEEANFKKYGCSKPPCDSGEAAPAGILGEGEGVDAAVANAAIIVGTDGAALLGEGAAVGAEAVAGAEAAAEAEAAGAARNPVVYRAPRKGDGPDEVANGVNPARHTGGNKSAYVGDKSTAQKYAGTGPYEDGYVEYEMHPDFNKEFTSNPHDGQPEREWQIPHSKIGRFNDLTITRKWINFYQGHEW